MAHAATVVPALADGYYHFSGWRIDGRLRRAHDRLREEVREAKGCDRDPNAAVIDSQVVKTTRVAPSAATTGRSASPGASAVWISGALRWSTGCFHWVTGERKNDELFLKLLEELRSTYRSDRQRLELAVNND